MVAEINGQQVGVALDNCCTQSCISMQMCKQLKLDIKACSSEIDTSGGSTKPYGQSEHIGVTFEGIHATVSFLVTKMTAVDVLLGIDWFK